ncbi:MAG: type II toxin-antitoxin system HicB family antitoxin [Gammaproteobacteria bacterium]|nr:type II toxin-antitoxin system HicB family antitoxin [Gammaproteobacteria bacterium]
MPNTYDYPAEVQRDEDGRFVVVFPDFGWGATDGATYDEALAEAKDLLRELIATTIREGKPLPAPSRTGRERPLVVPPVQIALKAALYEAWRETGISQRRFARELEVAESEVRRMLNPEHSTKAATIDRALRRLGKRASVSVGKSGSGSPTSMRSRKTKKYSGMRTFPTPVGRAGSDQLYGIQESINSHLERMFMQGAKRNILEHGVGRTTSTAGGIDSKVQLHAQQRDCDAAITFHAGKAVELSMQLIYAHGTDRIIGREFPGVRRSTIKKDVEKGHDLVRLYRRILEAMTDRNIREGLEDTYQTAINRGINGVYVDGEFSWWEFATVEDIPFREEAIMFIGDGMEMTADHTEPGGVLVPRNQSTDFETMPLNKFAQFLEKADAAYYEGDIGDQQGRTSRKNMRWADYSARDHEYGRVYAVAGTNFFARLVKELVGLANQHWTWNEEFALRWWRRRKYNIQQLLETHVMQNFHDEIDLPEMISAEEAMASFRSAIIEPEARLKRGYEHLRGKREIDSKRC